MNKNTRYAAGMVKVDLIRVSLGVSVDVLLGLAAPRSPKKIATNRLERRLLEIEKLEPKAKRQITQLLDSFIEGQKFKQRATQRASRASEAQH